MQSRAKKLRYAKEKVRLKGRAFLFIFGVMVQPIQLSERITYLPATRDPLSADVFAVRGDSAWWIFDVGMSDVALSFIGSLSSIGMKKNIVISHFHKDHVGNLVRVRNGDVSLQYDNLYVSPQTRKYTKAGTLVTEPMEVLDGLRLQILPVPSSHAKGSLVLVVDNELAFLGDASYPTVGHDGPDFYNVQQLLEQIKFLEELDVKSFCLSHKRNPLCSKESMLVLLKSIYARREKGDNLIVVNDF